MRWYLLAIAAATTGVAVWAGPNLAIATPAAVAALAAALLLFEDVYEKRARPFAARVSPRPGPRPDSVCFFC